MHGKYLKEMLGYALLAALGDPNHVRSRRSTHVDDDYKEPVPKVIPKGCKEYTFHGITVIAVSEKSARKKIERRLKNAK